MTALWHLWIKRRALVSDPFRRQERHQMLWGPVCSICMSCLRHHIQVEVSLHSAHSVFGPSWSSLHYTRRILWTCKRPDHLIVRDRSWKLTRSREQYWRTHCRSILSKPPCHFQSGARCWILHIQMNGWHSLSQGLGRWSWIHSCSQILSWWPQWPEF